jgi:hypothetical protein
MMHSALKMEVQLSSETLEHGKNTTWRDNSQDHRCEILKSYNNSIDFLSYNNSVHTIQLNISVA